MPRADKAESAVVVGKAYDFVLWLLPKVEKFSRSYRLSVGAKRADRGATLTLPRGRRQRWPRVDTRGSEPRWGGIV